jgi:hypothetical protein
MPLRLTEVFAISCEGNIRCRGRTTLKKAIRKKTGDLPIMILKPILEHYKAIKVNGEEEIKKVNDGNYGKILK